MKSIKLDNMQVICWGDEWDQAISPCSKGAVVYLEKNERYITWLQPNGKDVSHQIPVIRFNGRLYTLSLRMMKAVYRHVRLCKGFVNREIVNGTTKLKIPNQLLKEKIRTQSRFDVRICIKFLFKYNNAYYVGKF